MAKATVLICDHCKLHTPAVVTFTLSGRGKDPTRRDFCANHAKQVFNNFAWTHNHLEESKPKRKMNGPSPLKGRTKFEWNLTDAEAFVKEHESFTAVDLAKHLNLHKTWVNVRVVPKLIEMGIIRAEGKGRRRVLSK